VEELDVVVDGGGELDPGLPAFSVKEHFGRMALPGALALICRGGLRREEDEWGSPGGQRTTAIAEAVLWALLRIATGTE
jgi:hypothetical protein